MFNYQNKRLKYRTILFTIRLSYNYVTNISFIKIQQGKLSTESYKALLNTPPPLIKYGYLMQQLSLSLTGFKSSMSKLYMNAMNEFPNLHVNSTCEQDPNDCRVQDYFFLVQK